MLTILWRKFDGADYFLLPYFYIRYALHNPHTVKLYEIQQFCSHIRIFQGKILYFLRFWAKIRYVSRLEGHLRLSLKTSKTIQKKSHHQKFRHNVSCIFLHLYIYLSILYGEVVFPLKSWIHIICQNSVLFTFWFILGFPLKSEID